MTSLTTGISACLKAPAARYKAGHRTARFCADDLARVTALHRRPRHLCVPLLACDDVALMPEGVKALPPSGASCRRESNW